MCRDGGKQIETQRESLLLEIIFLKLPGLEDAPETPQSSGHILQFCFVNLQNRTTQTRQLVPSPKS